MRVTVFEIVTEVRPVQAANAYAPTLVTLFGSATALW